MNRMLGRAWLRVTSALICVLLVISRVFARTRKERPYRHSDVDMPISLAVGTIRTPEFPVSGEWYDIMVQVEAPRVLDAWVEVKCMMGLAPLPIELNKCSKKAPLLQAQWKVLDGDHVIDEGTTTTSSGKFEEKHMYRFLGQFGSEAGKKYVVEVRFTIDGTPLNVANPHLIVVEHRNN